jgi:chromosome segregation ATPase
MSTSPSWFDQEKFSRLVKKVGPKNQTEPLPSISATGSVGSSSTGENLASTARISLVSKPPSLLAEHRALPALPRRTAPLPNLKPLFATPPPIQPPVRDTSFERTAEVDDVESHSGQEDLSEVWQKMGLLNEELARTIQERDQAVHESQLLREQLEKALAAHGAATDSGGSKEEIERLTKERDEALELARELTSVTGERDQARKQYAGLRLQFETYKQEQAPKEGDDGARKELEKEVAELRLKLAEKDRGLAALRATSSVAVGGDEKLKEEMLALREQLAKAKEEANIAQRGLALSQKALHETRDTLREATEGTSISRHNFDNLKNECAILSQQNTTLQAQNEQLARDLAAFKAKSSGRL